jgi:hypothetical protein
MEKKDPPEQRIIDHNGNHLLHHAMKYSSRGRLPVLKFLMKEYPDAVILSNKRGELPIHQCVSPQRVYFLLQSDPYLLLYTTNEGCTVVGDIIDRLQDVQEMVDEEVRANPDREQEICHMYRYIISETSNDLLQLYTVLNEHFIPPLCGYITPLLD